MCHWSTYFGSNHPPIYDFYDNVGTMQLCSNPLSHSHMKHVGMDFHFIRNQIQNGVFHVAHVSSKD